MRPGGAIDFAGRIALTLAAMALLAAGCTSGGSVSAGAAGAAPATPATPMPAAGCATPASEAAAMCAPFPAQATSTRAAMIQPEVPTLAPTSLSAETAVLPTPSPTACPPDLCSFPTQLVFSRPIAPPGNDAIDPSYRFGSTQGKTRDPHHGVEFLNPLGTPVLAAADGEVIVAGDDRKTFYGPYSYFYGNLVVLQHSLPGTSQPVFTLYGHLSKIDVHPGERVQRGQKIGEVGMTGVATGAHLHFEVRLGENTYKQSRNPELWLAPRADESGQPMGALAVRVVDGLGNNLKIEDAVIERLQGADGPTLSEVYLKTYEEKALLGQPPFAENFGAGDLPAGWYRISFAHLGLQTKQVQVFPGQLTLAVFQFEY